MIRQLPSATGSLLADMRQYFGLSQSEMAYLLGLKRSHVSQIEAGSRTLPVQAIPHLRALQVASQAPPAPLPLPDVQPLHYRLLQCRAQADRMQLRLTYELPPRAAAASARLKAVDALPEALATANAEEPLPPRTREDQLGQLILMRNHARDEWDERSGPMPAALLRARLAGLKAEAEALALEMAELSCSSATQSVGARPEAAKDLITAERIVTT
jgi:transcriptional regulator with XRE-family HTH domain